MTVRWRIKSGIGWCVQGEEGALLAGGGCLHTLQLRGPATPQNKTSATVDAITMTSAVVESHESCSLDAIIRSPEGNNAGRTKRFAQKDFDAPRRKNGKLGSAPLGECLAELGGVLRPQPSHQLPRVPLHPAHQPQHASSNE